MMYGESHFYFCVGRVWSHFKGCGSPHNLANVEEKNAVGVALGENENVKLEYLNSMTVLESSGKATYASCIRLLVLGRRAGVDWWWRPRVFAFGSQSEPYRKMV